MTEEQLQILIDLHKENERQGPGSEASFKQALALSALAEKNIGEEKLKIADIGCGTGASSMLLAKNLNAEIYAVDFLPAFLSILEEKAQEAGVSDKIQTFARSMDDLPFQKDYFDAIWSEGAIYNIGFRKGLTYLKDFLKKDGIIALSEITWLSSTRPSEITEYWTNYYPEIATTSEKIAVLEELGFSPIAYFYLPISDWLDNYYAPLQARHANLIEKYGDEANEIITAEKEEFAMYQKYKEYYSYGFYIARKV